MDTWGRIDGLIHNAAIVLDDHFEDVTDDDLDTILAVNLRGTFRTLRAVYRAMKDTGGGRIVTLTSASGSVRRVRSGRLCHHQDGGAGHHPLGRLGGHAVRHQSQRAGPGRLRHPPVLGVHPRTATRRCADGRPNSRSPWTPRNTLRCSPRAG